MEHRADDAFRLGVPSPDARHHFAALFGSEDVGHAGETLNFKLETSNGEKKAACAGRSSEGENRLPLNFSDQDE